MTKREVYNREKHKFYAQAALGGVWAWWPDQAEWEAKKPGRVEFIAAGSGFGPDILEAAANVFQRPLVLGEGWDPAIELFDRYGGTVRPTKKTQFSPVQRADARTGPGQSAVKSAACNAFNAVSLDAGILPRYQAANDRYSEDAQKLSADAAISK